MRSAHGQGLFIWESRSRGVDSPESRVQSREVESPNSVRPHSRFPGDTSRDCIPPPGADLYSCLQLDTGAWKSELQPSPLGLIVTHIPGWTLGVRSRTCSPLPCSLCENSGNAWRRGRFGVRQLAAALVRPACRPYTRVGWLLGASKLAGAKRQQAAALQSCAPNGRLRRAEELSHRLPWGGWLAAAFSPAGAGRAFARRRVMDAQGAQPAMARRRVRGRFHGEEGSNGRWCAAEPARSPATPCPLLNLGGELSSSAPASRRLMRFAV
jgi:hypothetical protein